MLNLSLCPYLGNFHFLFSFTASPIVFPFVGFNGYSESGFKGLH